MLISHFVVKCPAVLLYLAFLNRTSFSCFYPVPQTSYPREETKSREKEKKRTEKKKNIKNTNRKTKQNVHCFGFWFVLAKILPHQKLPSWRGSSVHIEGFRRSPSLVLYLVAKPSPKLMRTAFPLHHSSFLRQRSVKPLGIVPSMKPAVQRNE